MFSIVLVRWLLSLPPFHGAGSRFRCGSELFAADVYRSNWGTRRCFACRGIGSQVLGSGAVANCFSFTGANGEPACLSRGKCHIG